jgi:hypothetical protein
MLWGEDFGYRAAAISSGKRTARQQRQLVARYEAGDPSVIVRPAVNSAHLEGRAFDLERVPHLALYGQLVRYLPGARWGGYFSDYDPVHFDNRS